MRRHAVCTLAVISIAALCTTTASAQKTETVQVANAIRVAASVIANRGIADTVGLKAISVFYSKAMPLVWGQDTIGELVVGDTLGVRFFRRMRQERDGNSVFVVWQPIYVGMPNNDTSKATVRIEGFMTTGGKGYTIMR